VPKAPQNDLDELYVLAQLVAKNDMEATRMVEYALLRKRNDPTCSSKQAILEQVSSTVKDGSSDLLTRARFTNDVIEAIPDIFANLPAKRRIAVRDAFSHSDGDSVERTTFRYLLQRKLDRGLTRVSASELTDQEIHRALNAYLNSVLAPVPSVLRLRIEEESKRRQGVDSSPKSDSTTKKSKMAARIAGGVLLILIVSAIATWIAKPPSPVVVSGNADFISQLDGIEVANDLAFTGSDHAQIERFMEDRMGFRATVPIVQDHTLLGLSIAQVFEDVSIPVLHFQSNSDDLYVFILTYSMILAEDPRTMVDEATLNQIAHPRGLDVTERGEGSRMVFRNRDDIYVIYTDENPLVFRNGVQFN